MPVFSACLDADNVIGPTQQRCSIANRDFALALKRNFVSARLLYVPGESHISELISLVQDQGPLVDAILSAVNNQ